MDEIKRIKMQRTLIYVFFALLTILSIIPFWIVMANSTRTAEQIQQGMSLIPGSSFMDNWNILRDRGFNIFDGYRNSLTIAGGSTILSMYFSCLTAYGFTVYEFKGKKILFSIVLHL